MSVKVLVCGGRGYIDSIRVEQVLDQAREHFGPELCIVNGGARGADSFARHWCAKRGVACITMDAMWDYYGNKAGPVRNAWMLKYTVPQYVIAFPGGRGTASMCKMAKDNNIPVYNYT